MTWIDSAKAPVTQGRGKRASEDELQGEGAHLIGVHAEETINVFALSIRPGTSADVQGDMPWAYPTAVSSVSSMV